MVCVLLYRLPKGGADRVNSILYIIGAIVVIIVILKLLGLYWAARSGEVSRE